MELSPCLFYCSFGAYGFWGPNTALYAIYTDQSGNTTEGFFLVYAICSVLIGLYLLANWRSSEDIDKAKKPIGEKNTIAQAKGAKNELVIGVI